MRNQHFLLEGKMKKQLLTSTALVAAGALVGTVAFSDVADARPKITIGGGAEQIIGIGGNEAAFEEANGQRVGFDQHSDGEVHFNGAVDLDNGIKIRTRVELESNSAENGVAGGNSNVINGAPGTVRGGAGGGSADLIDEHWMRISGSFGEIRMGSGDPAGMAMTTGYLGTWSTGVGQLLAFDTTDWITRPGTVTANQVGRVDLNSDSEHVSYFTPRFNGLQVGISYVPSTQEDVNNQRALTSAGDTDHWSFGINYNGKFGDASVGVAAGYSFNNESTVDRDDDQVWGVGVRVDMAGFRVAMSFVDNDEQETISTGISGAAGGTNGQEVFEMGVRYIFGANAVSGTYQKSETTGTIGQASTQDETETMAVAYRRTLGPGVFWRVTAMFADYDDGLAGAAAGNSNEGEALTTSILVRF
jgi:outer membrane protein OmpU